MVTAFKTFLPWWLENWSAYSALLLDIDGTVATKETVLPGAGALLAWLKKNSFPHCFLTNDGDHSREEKSAVLQNCGLQVSAADIVSCSLALRSFAAQYQQTGKRYFVMGNLGVPCYAENAGLKVTRQLEKLDQCRGVIIGEGYYDWHQVITGVINFFLRNPSRFLVVPNPDTYWPDRNGGVGVGAGGKARFMTTVLHEAGVEIQPLYLGKPYPMIYEYTLDLVAERYFHGNRPELRRVLMLGDSLYSDIRGANRIGLKAGLLMSGVTTPALLKNALGELQPDFIFDKLM